MDRRTPELTTNVPDLPYPPETTQVTERLKGFKSKLDCSRKVINPSKRNGQANGYSRPGYSQEGGKSNGAEATVILDKGDSTIKRAGSYFLGPKQGSSPVKCIQQYLARKDGTDEFYVIKILTRKDVREKETTDDIQGKTLLHTEHSLLSLVKNEKGVIHEHGMLRETVQEKVLNEMGQVIIKDFRRLCLVLDCYEAHDFSPKYSNITNMHCYLRRKNELPESEAIRLFCKVVQIVERLHKLNIVHRDLRLGNFILNMDSGDVTLVNFCLGTRLSSDNDLLKDQKGSPAYISPEIISRKPYLGKPSDMWALGVVLYTMLFGQFPFYDQSPTELFRKIKLGEFYIPVDVNVSINTQELIKALLVMDPKERLTATQALENVRSIIADEQNLVQDYDLQLVPMKRTSSELCLTSDDFAADIASILAKSEDICNLNEFEPQRKHAKVSEAPTLDNLISQFTLDGQQLQKLHATYVAHKITEAASAGRLSAQMITKELANQISTSSSIGLIKSATTSTDRLVPDDGARMMNTATSVGGLESEGSKGC